MSQIPIGWLMNRKRGVSEGVEPPLTGKCLMIDGINQLPAPLPIFTKPGHIIANSWLVGKKIMEHPIYG
jgi:hypothetical protein